MFDRLSWLLLVACLALPTSAQAQQYPDQTNAVVVFAAEGQFRFSVMVYMRRHIHQSLKDIGVHPLAGMSIWEKLPKPRYRELDTCIDEADCLERIRAQVDAQHIILVSIARTKGEPFAVELRISGPTGQGRSHRFEEMKLWPLYQTTALTVKSAWSAYQRGEREVLPEPVERQQSTEPKPEESAAPVADTVSEPAPPPVAAPAPADVAEPAAEEVAEAVPKESVAPVADTASEPAPPPAAAPAPADVAEPAAEEIPEAVPEALVTHGAEEPQAAVEPVM